MRALALSPPPFTLDAEIEWVLRFAFAGAWQPQRPVRPARVLALLRALGLSARVAGRADRRLLEAGLGEKAAELANEGFQTAAQSAMLRQAQARVASVAERCGVPLIGLKFAALQALGVLRPAQRRAHDLDLLVPRALSSALRAALLAAGFHESGARGHAHQLAPLLTPEQVPVELHLHVPGVQLPGSPRFVTGEELIAAGLVGKRGALLVPDPLIVSAHALAHGFLQNAGTPGSHSLFGTFADLSDLDAGSAEVLERAAAYLEPRFDRDDAHATAALVQALQAGDLKRAADGKSGVLLRHALAARLDARYAASLRLRLLTAPLSDRPLPLALASAAGSALFPGRAELTAIYGSQSRAGLVARRLVRPLDLALRLGRAGAARWAAR